jgi:hypothetical protein
MTSAACTTETWRQETPHRLFVADEDDVDAGAGGLQRAAHDLAGRLVAAGRIDHDAHHAIAGGVAPRRRDLVR